MGLLLLHFEAQMYLETEMYVRLHAMYVTL
jgi:hypothetical protein